MAKIKLGTRVRDKLTGYEGVATSRSETVGGFSQLRVDHMKPDGAGIATEWIPEKQLELAPEQTSLTGLDPVTVEASDPAVPAAAAS